MEYLTTPALIRLGDNVSGTATYNPQLANVLNKLEALPGCPGVEVGDIANLVKALHELNDPLRQIHMLITTSLAGRNIPEDSPIYTIEKNWKVLQDMTIFVVNELGSRRRYPMPKASPLWIWSKVCLIKALFHTEKLQVLANSFLRIPRVSNEQDVGYNEAEDKYHKALDNAEQDLVEYYRKASDVTQTLSFTEKPQTVCDEEGVPYEVERAELLNCQKKLLDCKAALRKSHEKIDRPKLDDLMKQEAAADFRAAEATCRELIKLEQDRAMAKLDITDATTILNYKHKLAELLMSQKKYIEAEDVAKEVWKERNLHLGGTKPTFLSLLLYCKALRRQKFFNQAYEKHRGIWELPKGKCDESGGYGMGSSSHWY